MNEYLDQQIITSWKKNVQPWLTAMRDGEIESRILITNQAVIDAVRTRDPKTVLDIGCGEGWLVRALENLGIRSFGVDVSTDFIKYAQNEGSGKFRTISYKEISSNTLDEKFDVVVCNFSLLGNESVNHIFKQVPCLLNHHGSYIVQTLHPVVACGQENYEDGWRAGSWEGFSEQFSDPAPWYFRTLDSWKLLFQKNGLKIGGVVEPIYPATNKPASIIFIGDLI